MGMEAFGGIFRVLSLLIVWAIPAVLIIAVGAFVVGAPALTLGGLVLRLYSSVSVRLRRKTQAEPQGFNVACSIDADCPPGFVCANGYCVSRKG